MGSQHSRKRVDEVMPTPTLVDTDIIIDSGRGVIEADNCLNNIKATSSLAICVVTQMELMVGCRNKAELRTLEKFLKKFQVVPLACFYFR